MQIAPSVYFYPFTSQLENNCNTIIIDGPEKVMIDPGHKHLWPQLVGQIEADGLSPADISLVIHTHCHPDHMEAGEILEFEYGATQAMSEPDLEYLRGPGLGLFDWMGLDHPRGSIGRTLTEGPLDLGDKTIDLYLCPGHSPGSLCLHWPEAGVLITGDVIFARSFGRTDFPQGDSRALAASIDRLSALPKVEIMLPGHGPSIIGADRVRENFQLVKSFL